jgi:hypothetical protein
MLAKSKPHQNTKGSKNRKEKKISASFFIELIVTRVFCGLNFYSMTLILFGRLLS